MRLNDLSLGPAAGAVPPALPIPAEPVDPRFGALMQSLSELPARPSGAEGATVELAGMPEGEGLLPLPADDLKGETAEDIPGEAVEDAAGDAAAAMLPPAIPAWFATRLPPLPAGSEEILQATSPGASPVGDLPSGPAAATAPLPTEDGAPVPSIPAGSLPVARAMDASLPDLAKAVTESIQRGKAGAMEPPPSAVPSLSGGPAPPEPVAPPVAVGQTGAEHPATRLAAPVPTAFSLLLSKAGLAAMGEGGEEKAEATPATATAAAPPIPLVGADLRLMPVGAPMAAAMRRPDLPGDSGGDAEADPAVIGMTTGTNSSTPFAAAVAEGQGGTAAEAARLPLRQMATTLAAHPDQGVELVLAPEELGRVRLVLHPADGGVSVRIVADRPETLDLMRRHAAELAGELQSLGFGTVNFGFGEGDRPPQTLPQRSEPALASTPFSSAPPAFSAAVPSPGRASGGLDLRL